MEKVSVQDFKGRLIGYIETLANGDKRVTKANGITLGFYIKASNITTDLQGRVLYRGDMSSALLLK